MPAKRGSVQVNGAVVASFDVYNCSFGKKAAKQEVNKLISKGEGVVVLTMPGGKITTITVTESIPGAETIQKL